MPINIDDPLGYDFAGIRDIDNNLTATSGPQCVAEAVCRRWITQPGGLFYNKDYGAGLLNYISGFDQNILGLPALLEYEAKKDERVEDCKVSTIRAGEELKIAAALETAAGPFNFVLSLTTTTLTLEILDT